MRRLFVLSSLFAILFACEEPPNPALTEPLLPAETFTWCDQPITFQPPPADWRRDRHNQGGLRGVWFVHSRSVGERIYVSEYHKVGERNQRERRAYTRTIDEFVDEVKFSTKGWPLPADSFVVGEVYPDTVAGVVAYSLDFTMSTPDTTLVGREYYFLKNGYLFEAAFLGLWENLPLFERVVETISFEPMGTD
jgi:hypothetical protein